MSGRPIRFVGATLVGWVAIRAVLLWPVAGPAAIPHTLVPAAFADSAPLAVPEQAAIVRPAAMDVPRADPAPIMPARPVVARAREFELPSPRAALIPAPSPRTAMGTATPPQTLLAPPPATNPAADAKADRWSASAWFALRDGRGIAPGLGGGQLGGSQTGLRVAYAIGNARRVAIVGRVATPLKGSGREAAIGAEWQPTALPVRLVAEYRIPLDGGTGGPAAGVIAGTGPAPLALGFDLETYGQAGVIHRRRAEPYAEGAARLSRRVLTVAGAKVDLGLGGWGGAQRGVQRLDIGPSLGVRIPVAGKAIRASFDWRQRIAGNAHPGSGPVVVIGGDF